MDWDKLEARTRKFNQRARCQSDAEIMQAAANSYHQDRLANQDRRLFCIVEKDTLSGVLEPTCMDLDIPLLAARGYPSVTVLREFAIQAINPAVQNGQQIIILHLGDHDPSGLDMTRDLEDRLALFVRKPITLHRIALNLDQIREVNPPENPAKTTDKRFADYARRYGHSSWELDALPPDYLARLVKSHAAEFIDLDAWQASEQVILETRARLRKVAGQFDIKQDHP
jgi:hypothetical protein